MKLVVDANRIFSAVLRDGDTRRIIFSTSAELYAPEALRAEIARFKDQLLRRSGLAAVELGRLLDLLFAEITWVGTPLLEAHLVSATRALGKRDPKDVPYLAAALAIGADAIWSHDTHFDAQSLVRRVSNADLK